MASRIELHERLCDILGSRNVYFQPPMSKQLSYPCIIYERSTGDTTYADNWPYMVTTRYTVTYISKNPDDPMVEKLAKAFQSMRVDRHFTADNLNHDTFELYYHTHEEE